jgi:hypothetical protein
MVMGMADIVLTVCYIALCALVIASVLSIVAILIFMVVKAFRIMKEGEEYARKAD